STGAVARNMLGQLSGSVAALMSLLPFLRNEFLDMPQMEQAALHLRITAEQLNALEGLYAARSPTPTRFDLRSVAQDALSVYSPILSTSAIQASVKGKVGVSVNGDRGAVLHALLL